MKESSRIFSPKNLAIIGVIITAIVLVGFVFRDEIVRQFFRPTETRFAAGVQLDDLPQPDSNVQIVAEGLSAPWELVFLPQGDMLVTERGGALMRIGTDEASIDITGVEQSGEGGLLGLALHPEFEENQFLYLYLTSATEDGLINRVERYVYDGAGLSNRRIIIEDIPGASYHDGGRIAFGPDGLLYITTGDAGETWLAQQPDSLAGKTLRLRDDGSIPEGNPFNSPVYSYGHRNSQGLAWDNRGRLWQTEHGRSGVQSGMDELNLVTAGSNYGWPDYEGDMTADGITPPVVHSGASETWAPAGMAYTDGSLFFAGLRGQSLYQAIIGEGDQVELKVHFKEDFGRLRTVVVGPDGFLYIVTNNTDGRGLPRENDDKIIRINPALFGQ